LIRENEAKGSVMGDDIGKKTGLSEAEAALRLGAEGYNELPSSKKRSIFAIAKEVVSEPMFLLLVAGGGIYLILGDIQEALMLLGFVFIVMGITLYQERKTERALEALRDLKPACLGHKGWREDADTGPRGCKRRQHRYFRGGPGSGRRGPDFLHEPVGR
jgi:magnesium-transporting ATPase (P-type)